MELETGGTSVEHPDVKVSADAYLRLHDRQMAHYENTQGIEWKVSIGVWTLLVGAIVWASRTDSLTKSIPASGWFIALFLAVASHTLWLWLIHSSEDEDKVRWDRYRFEAEKVLGTPDVREPYKGRGKEKAGKVKAGLWLVSEAGPTFAMALVLWLLVACR